MAKKIWNNPIDKTVDWGGDATTGGAPVSGAMVQKFIKDSLNGKAGLFHYDSANNRYLVFADADTRDEYLADPTKIELILGTFDAPFNYSAEINLTSPAYNAVSYGSTGNYIDFTFDVKNKQGASTGENVTVTYTFIRNATKKVVSEMKRSGEAVHFNIDKYLGEGTNTVIIGVTGQTSLAATTVSVTYQVVNLVLTDGLDISKAYNLVGGPQLLEVPFTVSGYGTKVVEWYLDGELLPFVKADDEVVDVSSSRTKRITLANLQQGRHSLQMRACTTVNGESFYTDTLYRDVIIYTGTGSGVILAAAVTIPKAYGLLGPNDSLSIHDMVQYVPYTFRFASYSPSNAVSTEVQVYLSGELKATIASSNGVENEVQLTSSKHGSSTILLQTDGMSYVIPTEIQKSDTKLEEITNGLVLDFNAGGKSNNSIDKDQWSHGDYEATFSGFNWNNTSGWVNGRLEISDGASFGINYAPLAGTPTKEGKTVEIEWSTKNVTDDDAVVCDLRGENGVGILITATKVSMTSADGVVVETEYKSGENVRIGFVINRASGATNQRMSFIYANGIVSRGEKWAVNDSYASDAQILFKGSKEAQVSLKSIRVYDNALTDAQMLNNFILYRDTVAEMMEVYSRNDVYEDGTTTFSPDKMMGRLPVMIVTGDIPVLENTSDKDTQIVVDIEYHNLQDPSRSFTMKGAAMRPQGTSSMGYPKKNFRIYTQKVDGTMLYDANGNVVEDRLYSFKEGAQPVSCWCLKADYAESSGTHNTGIARLWNDALKNAQVDGEYVCRTEAQKKAIEAGYKYDVRTTIDGFPILLFYRPAKNDDVIFIGKYNFNNDKSTESVFGFKGIPNFDNSRVQCWEILNNGNPLALFTSFEDFDAGWSEAFESRYPDTKTPYLGDLKAFCRWMSSVSQADFATEKWEHLNVYMLAAYWVYFMRFAAVDQLVKNAMLTTEDGQHFFFILYDNDTINGLINTGRLRVKPTDDRQTLDEAGAYVFAGHDSRLWNLLEADEDFKNIISAVDNALFSAGITLSNVVNMFDVEQAGKWVEAVYNQDAQYKYVGPFVEKGIDNLFMLQGNRDLHRRWWLAKRFSIYDAKYVSGAYKSQAVEFKCINGTPAGQSFTIKAGYPLDYGYGINNVPREFGVSLNAGESHTFVTKEVVNLGDPIRIYGAPNVAEIDFSPMASQLAVVTIANVYAEALGTKLTKLVLGKAGVNNNEVSEISGLKQAIALEHLDVQGMNGIRSLDLSGHPYFKTLKALGSGVASVTFAKGAPVESLELSSAMRVLSLEQLPYLASSNVAMEDVSSLAGMTVRACPFMSNDFGFVWNWIERKATADGNSSLIMDSVDWTGVSGAQMLRIASLGNVSLKGRVVLTDITEAQGEAFIRIFGDSVFNESSDFYIDAPLTLTLEGPSRILEGEGATFRAGVYPPTAGTVRYSLKQGRTGCSINSATGVLSTTENGVATSDIIVAATFTTGDGQETMTAYSTVTVERRVYPAGLAINGDGSLKTNRRFDWSSTTPESSVNGEYDVEWTISSGFAAFYTIEKHDGYCMLVEVSKPTTSLSGTITVAIKKKVDGSTVSSASKAIDYTYVYPTGVAISGPSSLIGGDKATYKATVSPSNVDIGVTYTWSVAGSSNVVATSNGDTCVLTASSPAGDESAVIACEAKSADGRVSVSATKDCMLKAKQNYVVATYNVTSTTDVTKLFQTNLPTMMEIDGVSVTPVREYLFSTLGTHTVKFTPSNTMRKCFDGVSALTSIDFSECRAEELSDFTQTFYNTKGLTRVTWGNCKFPNATTLKEMFRMTALTSVDLSPFEGAPITDMSYLCYFCENLTSVDLSSLAEAPIEKMEYAFNVCKSLATIYCGWKTAPVPQSSTFGTGNSSYTGRNSYDKGTNRLYVPSDSTGYESGYWLDPLCNNTKCGFILSKTL